MQSIMKDRLPKNNAASDIENAKHFNLSGSLKEKVDNASLKI